MQIQNLNRVKKLIFPIAGVTAKRRVKCVVFSTAVSFKDAERNASSGDYHKILKFNTNTPFTRRLECVKLVFDKCK